jgi:Glycosyl hydrolases family 16
MAGLLPNGSTPPANLYATVQVNPGTGTIAAAVSAHGGNTTYLLQNGTFIENNINVPNHVQFIGGGASSVTVRAASSGVSVFNFNNGTDLVTIWGMIIDLAGGNGSAIGGDVSDLLFQNVHVQNYASTVLHQEDFPVYLFATGYSPNNVTIDHCQFTQAASGSVDGTSVIATGAYRPADGGNPAANYTNLTVSNNLFDTPTDTGSAYYHCLGSAQQITGNVFVAPNFSNGQFWYEEAGSWNGNPNGIFQSNASNTSTLTGNTVTLAPNWDFAGVVSHTLGANENLVITGNTIHGNSSSGSVVGIHSGQGCPNPSQGFAITSLTLQNNAIDAGINLVNQGCTNGSPWITSPNNGITAVPSLTASAPNPLSNNSATLIGNVSANNGSNITIEGFDWGTTTSYGNSPNLAAGAIAQNGTYTLTLNGLTQGQQYHYRARATNSSGQGVSGDIQFIASTPSANDTTVNTVGPTITDSSGNVWAITSGGQVSLNGSATGATSYTSGVTEIAYVSGVVWQYNGTSWYSFTSSGGIASGPTSTSPITPFVQGTTFIGNATAVSTATTAAFATQAAGNTNVVAISYHSNTVLLSNPPTDSRGNVYTVISPRTVSDADTQIIYYCPSIVQSTTANSITVNFASAVSYVSIRAAEYHGIGAVDTQSTGSSTVAGTTASVSPGITTSNAQDLIIVCVTCGAGLNGTVTGFTERISASPLGSDLQDDSPAALLSTFTAPSPIISSTWVENLVAFLPSGSLSLPSLTVSSATGIGTAIATLNGSISSNGGQSITADGFDWGTTTSYGTHINVTPAVQSGSFLSNLAGLSPGTSYHYRATAQNASGTGVSVDQPFSTTSAGVAYSLVNHNYVNPSTVTGFTLTFAPAWAQSAGDILIVAIGYTSGSATVTVSDTANGPYSIAIGPTVDTPGGQTQCVFYRSNIALASSGSNTITCNFSASNLKFPDMRVSEFSSTLGTSWTVNQSVGLAAATAATDTSGNMPATTVSNALIYGAGYTSTVITAPGPGFTQIDITNTDANIHEYQVVTSIGSYAATDNDSVGGTVITQAVAFVATSAIPQLVVPNGYTLVFDQEFNNPAFNINTLIAQGTGVGPIVAPEKFVCHTPASQDFGSSTFSGPQQSPDGISPFRIDSKGFCRIKEWVDTSGTRRSGILSTVDSTGNGFSLANGFYACCAWVPRAGGTWSAFWMETLNMYTQSRTTNGTEIDVFEIYGDQTFNNPATTYLPTSAYQTVQDWTPANAHVTAVQGPHGSTVTNPANGQPLDLTLGWHVFSVLINGTVITFYIDNVQTFTATMPPSGINQPFFMMVDLAMGGGWPIDPSPAPSDNSDVAPNGTTYQELAIAYIRAYASPSVTAIPTLIQHASSGSNSNASDAGVGTGNPGNPFYFNLPNPSLTGNTLILEATGRVIGNPSITDNFTGTGTPNTWTFVTSTNDGNAQTSVFICIGATAGTQRLVITFSGNIYNAHFCCSEFDNITSVVGSNSVHNTVAATIAAGALTGGIQGDLVWMCGYDTQNANGLSSNITSIASGPGMALLSVDQFTGDFCQYGIQPTATNLAPTATISSSTIDAFNAVAIVLRAGTAGTGVPAGIRVMRVQAVTAERAIAIQFPSSGNLIYAQTGFGNNIAPLSFPSGWSTKLSVGGGQSSYLSNAGSSPNFSVLIGGTTTGIGNCTLFLYDIAGAATSPFDVNSNGLTTITGGQTNMVFGQISPTTPNGLCLITAPVFSGVVTAPSNAPQCMVDSTWYGNEAYDPDLMSNADGYAHIYNASAGVVNFTWTFLESSPSAGDTLQYLAVAFKAGATDTTAPAVPTGFSASTVSNSSISVNWTVPVAPVDPDNTNIQITYPVEHMGGEFPSFIQFGVGPGVVSGADSLLDSGLLNPGTTYSYRMRGEDPAGNLSGYTSTFTGSTSAADLTVPTVPGTPTLFSETSTGISIIWATSTDTQDSNASLTYTLQRSTNGGAFSQIATNIPGVVSGNILFTDAGLTPLTQYAYRVQAVNPANLSGSNSSNFSTPSATITTQPTPPFFVQGNSSSASSVTSATCSFTSAQTTGDGNLVVISTSSAAAISISGSVMDQAGHTYTLIDGPTTIGSAPILTQWIYYSNI